MKTRVIATLSALVLAVAFAFQPAAAATGTPATYDLMTRQFDPMSAGEFDGRLRITITPDGIVSGNFQQDDGGLRQVTGGLSGTKIWLQLGNDGFPFNGTFVDGKLTAYAQGHGLHTWTLEGKPRTHY